MERNREEQLQKKRRRRVNRLKRMIVTAALLLILILGMLCVVMGVMLHAKKTELALVKEEQERLSNQLAVLNRYFEKQEEKEALLQEQAAENEVVSPDVPAQQEEGISANGIWRDGKKHVYLTFDDGPSSNTAAILDILDEYGVKATFFVVGDTSEEGRALYRRIVEEGHSIGVHSFSHRYTEIYASKDAYFEDFYMMSDYLYDVAGVRVQLCRLPGGSSNTVSRIDLREIVSDLSRQGVRCYDWNVSGKDADQRGIGAKAIADNVLTGVERFHTSVVLLHDGRDKAATVEALRLILDALAAREDVVIEPIAEETPVISHITN